MSTMNNHIETICSRRLIKSFLERLQNEPSAIFGYYYRDCDTVQSLTFQDLSLLMVDKAQTLWAQTKTSDLVFIVSGDPLKQLLWWLASLCVGTTPGILTPLTPKLDQQKYFSEFKNTILQYKNSKILLDDIGVNNSYAHMIPEEQRIKTFSDNKKGRKENKFLLDFLRSSDGPVVFQQSSGTTRMRKGILLSETCVLNQLEAYKKAIQLTENDVMISWLPFYHDMGLVACLMQSVYNGIPLVFCSPFVWLQSPDWLIKATERHQATLCWLPNFAFNVMADRVDPVSFEKNALKSLRLIVSCAEPIMASSLRRFYERFKVLGLAYDALSSSYALAENTFAATQTLIDFPIVTEKINKITLEKDQVAVMDETGSEMVSSGVPLENVDIKILRQQMVCEEGQVGEIFLKSNCMMDGYFGVGQDRNPMDRDGWYATGDLGYFRGSNLFVIGRKDDLIIRAGRNINPTDIEEVVNGVSEVKPGRIVAFGQYREEEGTQDIVVMAEFGGKRVGDADKLRKDMSQALVSELGLSTQNIEIVRSNWLVKSSSGKISRAGCHQKYQQLRERRKIKELVISDYASNIPEESKDSFAYFGDYSVILTPTEILHPGRIKIGSWVRLGRHGKITMCTDFTTRKIYAQQHYPEVQHHYDDPVYGKRDSYLEIGDGSSLGDYFFISCTCSIIIGKHVLFSDRVFIMDSTHIYEHPDLPITLQSNTLGTPVTIGDHGWIGINVVILEGVKIGRHAVVSSNSVVTQDVPDFAVVAGNPARVVKFIHPGKQEMDCRLKMTLNDQRAQTDQADLVAILTAYIHQETGFTVNPNESLFTSGLIDSIESLKLLMFLEERLGIHIRGDIFFKNKPDTIFEIIQQIQKRNY